MRIVDRKTFLAMPENTVYCEYSSCSFGEIQIKTGNMGYNDFVSLDFNSPLETEDRDFFETCDRLESGESIPLDMDATMRDGMFEKDQLFCVYDQKDVAAIIKRLLKCL